MQFTCRHISLKIKNLQCDTFLHHIKTLYVTGILGWAYTWGLYCYLAIQIPFHASQRSNIKRRGYTQITYVSILYMKI